MFPSRILLLGLAAAVTCSAAVSGQVFQGCLKCGVDEDTLEYECEFTDSTDSFGGTECVVRTTSACITWQGATWCSLFSLCTTEGQCVTPPGSPQLSEIAAAFKPVPVERLRVPETVAAEIRAIDVSLGLILGSHIPQGRFNGLGDFLDVTDDGPSKGRFAFSGQASLEENRAIFNIELVDHPKWNRLSGEIRNDGGPSVLILENPGTLQPSIHTLGLTSTSP